MKLRYAIYFFIFPCFVEMAFSCEDCSSGSSGLYKFKEIEADHIVINEGQYAVTTAESVSKSAYGLLVNLVMDQNVAMKASRPFSFLPSAFACDPGPGIYPVDRFNDFKISSLQDFDESHPAGSNLSEYFEVAGIPTIKTLDEYVTYFGAEEQNQANVFYLILKTPPVGMGTFQFKLEASMKDGRKLEVTTTQIGLVE